MTAKLGQPVKIQITSGRYSIGMVCKIISGDTVNIVAFTDAVDPWPTIDIPNGLIAGSMNSVAKGTGVGQWQELEVPEAVGAAITAAIAGLTGYATEDYVSTAVSGLATEIYVEAAVTDAIAAIPADDDSGLCAVPGAGSAVGSPAMNSPRRPSTTRPAMVKISGIAAMTSTLLGAQSATVTIYADSSSSPTTVVDVIGPMTLSGVAATVTHAWSACYPLPAGHYYSAVATGNAAAGASITHINETIQ